MIDSKTLSDQLCDMLNEALSLEHEDRFDHTVDQLVPAGVASVMLTFSDTGEFFAHHSFPADRSGSVLGIVSTLSIAGSTYVISGDRHDLAAGLIHLEADARYRCLSAKYAGELQSARAT